MVKNSIFRVTWSFVFLVLFICCQHAAAEENRIYHLDEITVSAAKVETSVEKTATNIDVITREDIEKMPSATNINELLRQVPGLFVPQYQSGVANDGIYSSRGSEPSSQALRFLVLYSLFQVFDFIYEVL